MAAPPIQIYQFEDEFERAVVALLFKNGVNDPAKQRDYPIKLEDGTPAKLKTPRVEVKLLNGGFATIEHYYVNNIGKWLDIAAGTVYLKVVTRRDASEPSHSYLRGLCRYVMQQVPAISAVMKYHLVEKMIETQSTATFEADKLHDVSALSFQVWLRIRNTFFPTT